MNARPQSVAVFAMTLALVAPAPVLATAMRYMFPDLVRSADLIVEGVVQDQQAVSLDKPEREPMHYRLKSSFRIDKVHKGPVRDGDIIDVLSHQTFICNTSRLEQGQRYLLFLKRKDEVWHDLGSGQGTNKIVKRDTGQTVVTDSIRPEERGEPIEDFVRKVSDALAQPTSQPASQGLSVDEAREVARKLLSDAGVDLSKYEQTKADRLSMTSDVDGLARKGDPVWLFEWKQPEAAAQTAPPPRPLVGAYVHVRTARVRLTPDRLQPRRLTAEDGCRWFLKTWPYLHHKVYSPLADRLAVTPLEEDTFWRLATRSPEKLTELTIKPPAGSHFVRVDFKGKPETKPLVMMLLPDLTVGYAAIVDLPPKPPGPDDAQLR